MAKPVVKVRVDEAADEAVPADPAPSERLVADAKQARVVTDALGRRLTIQKPDILANSRLIAMVGHDIASNQVWMTMFGLPSVWIKKIDDDVIFPPMNRTQLDAILQRLGEEGVSAIVNEIMRMSGIDPNDPAGADKLDEQREAAQARLKK